MNWRRVFWLGLLVYLTLDAAVPEMPGAFVFDPDSSVEILEARRAGTASAVILPPLTRDPVAFSPAMLAPSPRPPRRTTPAAPRVVMARPRADCAGAPSPEDPH